MLTEAGTRFLPHAERALGARRRRAHRGDRALVGELRGTVAIGTLGDRRRSTCCPRRSLVPQAPPWRPPLDPRGLPRRARGDSIIGGELDLAIVQLPGPSRGPLRARALARGLSPRGCRAGTSPRRDAQAGNPRVGRARAVRRHPRRHRDGRARGRLRDARRSARHRPRDRQRRERAADGRGGARPRPGAADHGARSGLARRARAPRGARCPPSGRDRPPGSRLFDGRRPGASRSDRGRFARRKARARGHPALAGRPAHPRARPARKSRSHRGPSRCTLAPWQTARMTS